MLPFTVFTPTYNRARTLRRVFDSLCRQPSHLFEWLVVNDGSTDDTSAVLEELARTAPFHVRTITQPNGGKHRAHNAAVNLAKGELTAILDSDDELVPGALEGIWAEWHAIPAGERESFAGVIGHSVNAAGQLHGLPYSSSRVDGRFFELAASGAMVGEKLPCYRTDVLRRFPFPERAGCSALVPEGLVWTQIGAKYRVRCIDKVVRVYHRDTSDATALMNRYVRPESSAWGRMQYCLTVLNLSGRYWPRFAATFAKAATGYVRYALHSGCTVPQQAGELKGALPPTLWVAALPVGGAAWMLDRIKRWRVVPS